MLGHPFVVNEGGVSVPKLFWKIFVEVLQTVTALDSRPLCKG